MKFTVVIPARFSSTRLPGKALEEIAGKPMVQRVYERACLSSATNVWVATDDERISDALQRYDTKVLMTSAEHQSGTDRLAEAAQMLSLDDDEILVNVQGDEPLIPPEVIEQVALNLASNGDCACATLSESVSAITDFRDPSVVKVVADEKGRALYFSRAPIPWPRDQINELNALSDGSPLPENIDAQRHIGLYAYRVGLLRQFVGWKPSPLERLESLEQLRILEHGLRIHIASACAPVPGGVDTPEDLARVRREFSV